MGLLRVGRSAADSPLQRFVLAVTLLIPFSHSLEVNRDGCWRQVERNY
jgi:hypothetical protein